MSKPRIVVSRCLGYEACRYNDEIIPVSWRDQLEEIAEVITVCPEVKAGLGVPRNPINLHRIEDAVHVIQESTGLDCTDTLEKSTYDFLSSLGEVDGFILKSKSPSCGLRTTKIVFGDSLYLSSGVFAKKAMKMYPNAAFKDESSLEKDGIESFIRSL